MLSRLYELTLERVVDYLTRCGLEVTPATLERVLQVIKQAARHGETGLLSRVMDDLPNHFDLQHAPLHRPSPPLNRRSMGYG